MNNSDQPATGDNPEGDERSVHLARTSAAPALPVAGGACRSVGCVANGEARSREQFGVLHRTARRTDDILDDLPSPVEDIIDGITTFTSVLKHRHHYAPIRFFVTKRILLPHKMHQNDGRCKGGENRVRDILIFVILPEQSFHTLSV